MSIANCMYGVDGRYACVGSGGPGSGGPGSGPGSGGPVVEGFAAAAASKPNPRPAPVQGPPAFGTDAKKPMDAGWTQQVNLFSRV